VRSGNVKAYAVMAKTRLAAASDIPTTNQIGGQGGHSIVLTIRPMIFDRNVSAFGIAGLAQALTKLRSDIRAGTVRRENPNHRQRRLLRARRERPYGRRAARKNNTAPCPLLLIAHPSDKHDVMDLKKSLHEAGYEVFTINLEAAAEEETSASRLARQVDAVLVLFTSADELWAQTVLKRIYEVSVAREDNRPMVRAVLFREESDATVESFHSHYCNLVLRTSGPSWESPISELRAHLGRGLSS
jgi:hypothetical protein